MTLIPDIRNPLAKGITTKIPGFKAGISFDYFLDRQDVIDRIGKEKARALTRVGLKVMQSARRSIKKMGLARPKLKAMTQNPGVPLPQLMMRSDVSKRTKNKIAQRLFEIKFRPPSPAGTPPHTHFGTLRRNIVFAYDFQTESVVVGSYMQGGAWLASLHEFGGTSMMQAWAYVPPFSHRMPYGILGWYRIGKRPRLGARRGSWEPTSFRETWAYPERPYMAPAMKRCISDRSIPSQFRNMFRVGGL
jgi:hypothetical protein